MSSSDWVLLALGAVGLILAVGHATANPSGTVLACRDVRGMIVARYTTHRFGTMDGVLELSMPQGRTIEARCSIQ